MKKPKQQYICGKLYDIVWCNDINKVNDEQNNVVCYGHFDGNKNEIRVYNNGRPDDMFSWLFHECVHAIESELNFDIGESANSLLDGAVTDFLLRNRWVTL